MSSSKVFLLITGFISMTTAVMAQESIKWLTIEEAVKQNKKQSKKIFVDVYTDWCGWCKKMDASTFSHPVVVDYMNKKFYAVKLNAEQKEPITLENRTYKNPYPERQRSPHELAAELLDNRMSYPSTVFLDEKLGKITMLPGYITADRMEIVLHFIADSKYLTMQWADFEKDFKGEVK